MTHRLPRKARTRKTHFYRGTFGASAPLSKAESVTIHYKVKAGTIAWRWIAAAPESNGISPMIESFITSRDVVYGPEDLCKESFDRKPNSEVRQWYVFILPPSAAPWDRLKVGVNDVKEVI